MTKFLFDFFFVKEKDREIMLDKVGVAIMIVMCVLLVANEGYFNPVKSTGTQSGVQRNSSNPGVFEAQLVMPGERQDVHEQQSTPVVPAATDASSRTEYAAPKKNVLEVSPPLSAGASSSASCPPWNRTLWSIPDDFNAAEFCSSFSESAIPAHKRPRLFYGIMFGYEFDMLEVVLHETSPIVHKYILAESMVTHSLKKKRSYFADVMTEPRFAPFMHKIANYTFHPRGRIRSGWEIERRQRKFGLKGAFDSGIRVNDILIGNMDLDELFQATYLMRLKYCNVKKLDFFQFQFRYHLNCLMIDKYSQNRDVNFRWGTDSLRLKDLYKSRQSRKATSFDPRNYSKQFLEFDGSVNWHMGTFGTVEEIMRKLQNSPHRFLANVTEADVLQDIAQCRYNMEPRWMIPQRRSLLPKFIQQNMCQFKGKGWLPGDVTDD